MIQLPQKGLAPDGDVETTVDFVAPERQGSYAQCGASDTFGF